ncbi:MAG: hypothetical protein VW405_02605 [Rhodospirillaceae bacterium]
MTLPWACPNHPYAQIRHTWLADHYVLNQVEVSPGAFQTREHRYECAVCGRELAKPKEGWEGA